jgi:hypothetical protein
MAVGFFVWWHRRQRATAKPSGGVVINASCDVEDDGLSGKPELEGSRVVAFARKPELDASNGIDQHRSMCWQPQLSELPGSQMGRASDDSSPEEQLEHSDIAVQHSS